MKPAYSDDWTSVYVGDSLDLLRQMPASSVHCCVTSPPFWGLRSYLPPDHPDKVMELGAEPTPERYVERLVEVFRALRQVLRDDATLWLNLGDSYNAHPGQRKTTDKAGLKQQSKRGSTESPSRSIEGYKPKDLIGLPWMVAFALRSDGWYLRSEITWCKRAPMPESCADRPTSATEKLFLLTKKPRYFYDSEAVKEKSVSDHPSGNGYKREHRLSYQDENGARGNDEQWQPGGLRNLRNYWILGPAPYKGAHYATFPPDLVYPCIKAGTSEYGVCEECLAPWERMVEHKNAISGREPGASEYSQRDARFARGGAFEGAESRTVGWQPTCSCNADTVPATVLDPFSGSGTALLAARKLGRKSIGIDLDERNISQTEERLGYQGVMF